MHLKSRVNARFFGFRRSPDCSPVAKSYVNDIEYKNLPLLGSVRTVAQIFRCSSGQPTQLARSCGLYRLRRCDTDAMGKRAVKRGDFFKHLPAITEHRSNPCLIGQAPGWGLLPDSLCAVCEIGTSSLVKKSHVQYIGSTCQCETHMPRRKDETLSIRTSFEIKHLLQLAAERERRSVASMVEVLVLQYAELHKLLPNEANLPSAKRASSK